MIITDWTQETSSIGTPYWHLSLHGAELCVWQEESGGKQRWLVSSRTCSGYWWWRSPLEVALDAPLDEVLQAAWNAWEARE
jgi:hypothetical protein